VRRCDFVIDSWLVFFSSRDYSVSPPRLIKSLNTHFKHKTVKKEQPFGGPQYNTTTYYGLLPGNGSAFESSGKSSSSFRKQLFANNSVNQVRGASLYFINSTPAIYHAFSQYTRGVGDKR
jgi:hypothetical protein